MLERAYGVGRSGRSFLIFSRQKRRATVSTTSWYCQPPTGTDTTNKKSRISTSRFATCPWHSRVLCCVVASQHVFHLPSSPLVVPQWMSLTFYTLSLPRTPPPSRRTRLGTPMLSEARMETDSGRPEPSQCPMVSSGLTAR